MSTSHGPPVDAFGRHYLYHGPPPEPLHYPAGVRWGSLSLILRQSLYLCRAWRPEA